MKQDIIRIDLNGTNCYLAKAGDGFILFDTGGHIIMDKEFTNRREILVNELEKAGCMPGDLRLIVLTHGDNDHSANAAFLRNKYNTKIAMHPGDLELVEKPVLEKVMESFKYRSPVFKIVFYIMRKKIRKVIIKTIDDFDRFRPDILLKDEDSLKEYGLNAEILHLPGHTNGSVGILTEEGDFISGDTFTHMGKPGPAPNALDFMQLSASVKRLRSKNIKKIYPGHGEPFDSKKLSGK